MNQMGKWHNLPIDLLNVIEDNVTLYIDKVRIRAVCGAWNSYLPQLPKQEMKQLPWLLYPLANKNEEEATHGLFNPIDENIYNIYLPEAHGKLFKGSSYGWIVTVEDHNSISPNDMYLINPLTRARITLPPRTEFPDVLRYQPDKIGEEFVLRWGFDVPPDEPDDTEVYPDDFFMESFNSYRVNITMMSKVLISSNPCDNNDNCLVVANYGQENQLAWCRFNDKKWTHIYAGINGIVDIIFDDKDRLYALTHAKELFMIENIGSNCVDIDVTDIAYDVPFYKYGGHLAICSDGTLIVISRHYELVNRSFRTTEFKVYKHISDSSFIEVNNIGGDILFLGNYGPTRSISCQDENKGNRIYFSDFNCASNIADNNINSNSDVGVFNLEDRTFELLPGLHRHIWPRPIWMNVY